MFAAKTLPGLALLLSVAHAQAAPPATLGLTVKDHRFEPAELHAPAGTPIVIEMMNADQTAEEFDSDDLKTEKVAAAGRKVTIRLPPQQPGSYKFKGEYHESTAQGVLVVDPR